MPEALPTPPEVSAIDENLLLDSVLLLGKFSSAVQTLEANTGRNIRFLAYSLITEQQVPMAVDIAVRSARAVNIGHWREDFKGQILDQFLGRLVTVETFKPDITPVGAYESSSRVPEGAEMDGMAYLEQTRATITGWFADVFDDGSFRVNARRGRWSSVRKFALVGLGPRSDWYDAYKVDPHDASGNRLVSVTFL
jgi:hypothetical protein